MELRNKLEDAEAEVQRASTEKQRVSTEHEEARGLSDERLHLRRWSDREPGNWASSPGPSGLAFHLEVLSR